MGGHCRLLDKVEQFQKLRRLSYLSEIKFLVSGEMLGLQQMFYNICTTLSKRRRFDMISAKRRRSTKTRAFSL